MQEIKSVIFEKDELQYRNISIFLTVLPLLIKRESNSDMEDKFQDSLERIVYPKELK